MVENDIMFKMELDLSSLAGKTLLITGGTGMIGKWMIDLLFKQVECRVILLGRSEEKAKSRFASEYWASGRLKFIQWDPSRPTSLVHSNISILEHSNIDFIIHLASNTHPVAYATDPVSTIVMNVNAAKELLDLAVAKKARFVYASSVEIYGQNRGDCEKFKEDYCGYIDCNTLRAGYPESKRCGEALCQAYVKQYGLDVVIPRIARVYGPTLQKDDTKALSQFIHNALEGKDIVLKSDGKQYFSYLHVADAVSGILMVMLKGRCGEAYNIADGKSDITLRDLAGLIAKQCGRKVVFKIPAALEAAGFSPAEFARMESSKIKALDWMADYDIATGIADAMKVFKMDEHGTAEL